MAPSGDDTVKLDVSEATELLQKLQQKRTALEKELSKVPGAPSSKKDVFHLCRGFERAFTHLLETTDYAGFIRRAFMDEGLMGVVAKLPLERNFKLEHVKEVVREADGYQSHLVSPEFGLRRLVDETIDLVLEPVNICVRRVHQVLLDAAREASKKASLMMDSSILDESREPLKLPAFEKAVMQSVTLALEVWRDEAMEVARAIVEMEQGYVTAAFFRHRTAERYKAMMQAQQTAKLLGEGKAVAADSDSEDEDDDDSSNDGSPAKSRPLTAPTNMGGPLSGGLTIPATMHDPGDMLAGTLEKRIGEKSGRQSLPEAWKWQKRYFVLSEPQGKLYYFKSADDPPNYKGLIDMRECKAEDVDIDGLPRNASKSKYDLDGGGGQVSLLIRISHKDPSKPCVKNHHSLVLRTGSASDKYSWLARLRNAGDAALGAKREPRSYASSELQRSADSTTSSVAPTPRIRAGGTPKNLDVPKGGIGSSALFAEDSTLGPEPLLWASPKRFGDPANTKVFDDYLQQLGEDTAAYVRTVCQTIVLTVPKAVIHCQVKRAQAHLLEHLYSAVTTLGGAEAEYLLEEDSDSAVKREKLKQSVGEVAQAVAQLKNLQEGHYEDTERAAEPLEVPAEIVQLAEYRRRRPSDRSAPSNGPPAENGNRKASYDYTGSGASYMPTRGSPSAAPPARTISTASSGRRQSAAPPPRVSIPAISTASAASAASPSPLPRRRPPPAPPGETPR